MLFMFQGRNKNTKTITTMLAHFRILAVKAKTAPLSITVSTYSPNTLSVVDVVSGKTILLLERRRASGDTI